MYTCTYNYIDHSDWDSSKEEEEEEGEKKGAIKPDSKDLVDLKKKPVGGVLTPLVPISSNIPLEDETKKLLGESKIYVHVHVYMYVM